MYEIAQRLEKKNIIIKIDDISFMNLKSIYETVLTFHKENSKPKKSKVLLRHITAHIY